MRYINWLFTCLLTNMFLTMLGNLAVFWLYITLICSFLHYTTLHLHSKRSWAGSEHTLQPTARCPLSREWYTVDTSHHFYMGYSFIDPDRTKSWVGLEKEEIQKEGWYSVSCNVVRQGHLWMPKGDVCQQWNNNNNNHDQAKQLRLWVRLYRLPETTPTIAMAREE